MISVCNSTTWASSDSRFIVDKETKLRDAACNGPKSITGRHASAPANVRHDGYPCSSHVFVRLRRRESPCGFQGQDLRPPRRAGLLEPEQQPLQLGGRHLQQETPVTSGSSEPQLPGARRRHLPRRRQPHLPALAQPQLQRPAGGDPSQRRIPPSVGSLRRLQQLDLGVNMLAGVIPTNISRCTSLRVLCIYSNKGGAGKHPGRDWQHAVACCS